MTFFNFVCQNENLLETVLESFPDSDNFDYLLRKTYTKETQRDTITLERLQEKITTKTD